MKFLKFSLPLLVIIFILVWINWSLFNGKKETKKERPRIFTPKNENTKSNLKRQGNKKVEVKNDKKIVEENSSTSRPLLENQLKELGLVNVQSIDTSILVNLAYASPNNFMNRNVYYHCTRAYLQPEVAKMLANANQYLKSINPNLSLYIHDAARPKAVQEYMWNLVKGTENQKYVASPYNGSMHNYGAAVDVSLATTDGNLLDMGTPFDYFGAEAQPRYESKFLSEGTLKKEHIDNRNLLQKVMKHSGFKSIQTEWWHFNAFSKEETRKRYKIIE